MSQSQGAYAIEEFLRGDAEPEIIADWPDDVRLCCQALMIEPGVMADIVRLRFEIPRKPRPWPPERPFRMRMRDGAGAPHAS